MSLEYGGRGGRESQRDRERDRERWRERERGRERGRVKADCGMCVSVLKGLMCDRPSGFYDVHHALEGDKDWRGPQVPQTAP